MKDSRKVKGRTWRIVRRMGAGLAVILVLLGITGATWNALAIRHYRNSFPAPGKLYSVNGYTMHLYCTGEGSPVVVLESGLGEDFTVWGKIQPALSKTTRTCSYDRAGFGWSQARPEVRDAQNTAAELHALLQQAGITDPVVLMGHSAGGLYIRSYAAQFPSDVAGLIFVDATTPLPLPQPPVLATLDTHSKAEFAMVMTTIDLGIARAAGLCTSIPSGLDAYAGWIKANTCVPSQVVAYTKAYTGLFAARTQAAHTRPFGDLPILIFSQDPHIAMPAFLVNKISPADWLMGTSNHNNDQEAFKKLSSRSRRIIAQGSGHYIQYDRPDLLNREVPLFIQQIRDGLVSSDNGSTNTE